MNLNELKINTDDGQVELDNNNLFLKDCKFEDFNVLFRDLEENLIREISNFSDGLIFGSIAWLTSEKIIKALAKCNNVQIVVQKEDFLRPDSDNINTDWKKRIQNLYTKLKFSLDRYDCRYPINALSVCGDPTVEPVRCVGNYNRDKKSAFPRAHNKFLVFCKFIKKPSDSTRQNSEIIYKPISVWTGSFNLTWNATNSFENALCFSDSTGDNEVINAFLKEHHQLFAISEQLDWDADWVEPEFRIGT